MEFKNFSNDGMWRLDNVTITQVDNNDPISLTPFREEKFFAAEEYDPSLGLDFNTGNYLDREDSGCDMIVKISTPIQTDKKFDVTDKLGIILHFENNDQEEVEYLIKDKPSTTINPLPVYRKRIDIHGDSILSDPNAEKACFDAGTFSKDECVYLTEPIEYCIKDAESIFSNALDCNTDKSSNKYCIKQLEAVTIVNPLSQSKVGDKGRAIEFDGFKIKFFEHPSYVFYSDMQGQINESEKVSFFNVEQNADGQDEKIPKQQFEVEIGICGVDKYRKFSLQREAPSTDPNGDYPSIIKEFAKYTTTDEEIRFKDCDDNDIINYLDFTFNTVQYHSVGGGYDFQTVAVYRNEKCLNKIRRSYISQEAESLARFGDIKFVVLKKDASGDIVEDSEKTIRKLDYPFKFQYLRLWDNIINKKDVNFFPNDGESFDYLEACPKAPDGGIGTPLWVIKAKVNFWNYSKNSGIILTANTNFDPLGLRYIKVIDSSDLSNTRNEIYKMGNEFSQAVSLKSLQRGVLDGVKDRYTVGLFRSESMRNYYLMNSNNRLSNSVQMSCDPGYELKYGVCSKMVTTCSRGEYRDNSKVDRSGARITVCKPCAPGYYQDEYDSSSRCKPCTAGNYCSDAKYQNGSKKEILCEENFSVPL